MISLIPTYIFSQKIHFDTIWYSDNIYIYSIFVNFRLIFWIFELRFYECCYSCCCHTLDGLLFVDMSLWLVQEGNLYCNWFMIENLHIFQFFANKVIHVSCSLLFQFFFYKFQYYRKKFLSLTKQISSHSLTYIFSIIKLNFDLHSVEMRFPLFQYISVYFRF